MQKVGLRGVRSGGGQSRQRDREGRMQRNGGRQRGEIRRETIKIVGLRGENAAKRRDKRGAAKRGA